MRVNNPRTCTLFRRRRSANISSFGYYSENRGKEKKRCSET